MPRLMSYSYVTPCEKFHVSDNWEPLIMAIKVTWLSTVAENSIWNVCDVWEKRTKSKGMVSTLLILCKCVFCVRWQSFVWKTTVPSASWDWTKSYIQLQYSTVLLAAFQKIRTVVSFLCLFNINSPFDSLDEAPCGVEIQTWLQMMLCRQLSISLLHSFCNLKFW